MIKTCKWVKDHKIPPQSYVTCCFVGSDAVICCNDEVPAPHVHRNQTAPNEDAIVFRGTNHGRKNTTKVPTNIPITIPSTPLITTTPMMDHIIERKSAVACELFNQEANNVNLMLDEHILNGVSADPGEFPHIAAIGYKNALNEVTYDCGGSLISSKLPTQLLQ